MKVLTETVSSNTLTASEAAKGIIALCAKDYSAKIAKQPSTFEEELTTYIAKIDKACETPKKQKKFRQQLLRYFHPDKHPLHLQKFDAACHEHFIKLWSCVTHTLNGNSVVLQKYEQKDEPLTPNRWRWRSWLLDGRMTEIQLLLIGTKCLKQCMNLLPDGMLRLMKTVNKPIVEEYTKKIEERFFEHQTFQESLYYHPSAPPLRKRTQDAQKDIRPYLPLLYGYILSKNIARFSFHLGLRMALAYPEQIKIRCMQSLASTLDLSRFHQDIATDRLRKEKEWIDAQKKDMKFVYLNWYENPMDIFYKERKNHVKNNGRMTIPLYYAHPGDPSYFQYSTFESNKVKHQGFYNIREETLYHETKIPGTTGLKSVPLSLDVCYERVKSLSELQQFLQTFRRGDKPSPYYAYYVSVKDNPTNLYYFSKHTNHYPSALGDNDAFTLSDFYFTFNINDTKTLQSLTDRLKVNEPLSVEDIHALETLTNCPEIQNKKPIELLANLRKELKGRFSHEHGNIVSKYLTQILDSYQCEQYYLHSYTRNNQFKQTELTMDARLCFYLLCLDMMDALSKSLINNPLKGLEQGFIVFPIFIIYTVAFVATELLKLLQLMNIRMFELADAAVYSIAAAPVRLTRASAAFYYQKKDPSGDDIPPPTQKMKETTVTQTQAITFTK